MTASTPYAQNWDLDTVAPAPDTEEFTNLLAAYRTDLLDLANRADSLPALDPTQPGVLADWSDAGPPRPAQGGADSSYARGVLPARGFRSAFFYYHPVTFTDVASWCDGFAR